MDPAALQRIAHDVALAPRSLQPVLARLVRSLAREPGVALARVWLVRPGDVCADCAMRALCPERTRCLHLVASAGRSAVDPSVRWTRTDGAFRRFPIGVHKVGEVGASGRGALLELGAGDVDWAVRPEWARAEGIRAFAGQPLVFRGEVLGVLAVFSRRAIGPDELAWLRTFADQVAVAIASARAFEELAVLRRRLELERDYLREEVRSIREPSALVAESPGMRAVLRQVEQVAPTDAGVLVTGETGTGKERVAAAIVARSRRREAPFVKINCAAIASDLFESEFFGHVRGAFTGATGERAGRFQVADGGTLLLDEVGEIPLALQGKLLRALELGEVTPVGSDRVRHIDVRVIAATNRDLEREMERGRLRRDLYYRMAVFAIEVPPLRERRGDVVPLARQALQRAARRCGKHGLALSERDVDQLLAHDWPGNARELENAIQRAVVLAADGELDLSLGPRRASRARPFATEAERLERTRADIEAALEAAGGRVAGAGGAAELLGLQPSTLASRMRALGVRRARGRRGRHGRSEGATS